MKAIHDRYYASEPRTFAELRWRLQHIVEEEIGHRVREAADEEDAVAANIARMVG